MSLLVFMLPACNGETLPGPVLADNALQIRSVELPELSGTRALGATQLNDMSLITIIRLWPMRPMYINCRMAHGVVTLRPQ